jgi:hypothetical protein
MQISGMDVFVVFTTIIIIGIGLLQVKIMKQQGAVQSATSDSRVKRLIIRYWPTFVMILVLILSWVPYFLQTNASPPTAQEWKAKMNKLELVWGQRFGPDDRVTLDGKNIENNYFLHSALVFRGTAPFMFANNHYNFNGAPATLRVITGPQGTGASLVWDFIHEVCKGQESSCDLSKIDLQIVDQLLGRILALGGELLVFEVLSGNEAQNCVAE